MKRELGEIVTAMVTPFDERGEVNYSEAARLARWLTDRGNDGLVVAGSTGEGQTLSDDERNGLFRSVKEALGDRGTMIANAGSNETRGSVRAVQQAESAGADAILAVVPYYNKPTQSGMLAHFGALAQATSLPIIVYNIPGRTAANMLPETLLELALRHPNIVGVKESSGDLKQIGTILAGRGLRALRPSTRRSAAAQDDMAQGDMAQGDPSTTRAAHAAQGDNGPSTTRAAHAAQGDNGPSTTRAAHAAQGDTKLRVWAGDDHLFLPCLAMGADGVVGVASHLCSREYAQMVQAYREGRTAAACGDSSPIDAVVRGALRHHEPDSDQVGDAAAWICCRRMSIAAGRHAGHACTTAQAARHALLRCRRLAA